MGLNEHSFGGVFGRRQVEQIPRDTEFKARGSLVEQRSVFCTNSLSSSDFR